MQQPILEASIRDERQKQASEAPAEDADLYLKQMHEAHIWHEAIKGLVVLRGDIGRQIIAGLWHIFYNDMHSLLGEFNSLTEYVRDMLDSFDEDATSIDVEGVTRGTILDYALIVERFFPAIFARQNTKSPFMASIQGEDVPLTIDLILSRRGFIGKMKLLSSQMDSAFKAGDSATVKRIAETVGKGVREDAKKLRDELGGKKATITLPYRKIYHREDGTWRFVLVLDDEQRSFFEMQIKNFAQELTDEEGLK